ncbi:MAG: hypothetical protein LC768_17315 [Acidobacteria bacterium]|nr:hypothetical protein [Acidobacteriota bacterium]
MGSVLFYLPSWFAWWFIIYFQYVDFDKLIAPYRWTQHERAVERLWFFGPPLVPSLILLLFSLANICIEGEGKLEGGSKAAAQQSLAADGAIACFSSSLVPSAWTLIARRS